MEGALALGLLGWLPKLLPQVQLGHVLGCCMQDFCVVRVKIAEGRVELLEWSAIPSSVPWHGLRYQAWHSALHVQV